MACGNISLTKEQALWVLERLDEASHVAGQAEFGLPLFDAPHQACMREVLIESLDAVLSQGWSA